jgi:concentrative nucleoside transporter, CNT family
MLHNFMSFFGIFVFVALAWVASTNRRKMNWHALLWGIGLQLVFGFFVFQVPAGTRLFLFLNDFVVKVVDASSAGARFLFGALALPPGVEGSPGFILAFQGLPTIVFFSALLSVLYYVNLMPWLIRLFARIFTKSMRISGAESLCVASNIFVGVEAAFTVRPHLPEMTRSELCTLLTAGMASIASNVLALYVFILRAEFPTIAGHLISASILSAPAAVVMSKVLLPEEETPRTLGLSLKPHYVRESNLFEAIIAGANAGVRVVVGIAALLLAVLGLIELLDMLVGAAGDKLNALMQTNLDWSLRGLLGYLFYPLTLIMGVPSQDAITVAKIVGERTVATEVAGYQDLAFAISKGTLTDPRSIVITTYALCGFAHFASMAIFVGGTAALAPERTGALSQVAVRALAAATLACLMTGCVAGVFCTGGSILTAR